MMNLFVLLIYQPFLNILVFFYWILGQIPGNKADMGVAVILLSIVIRVLLLPVSLASDRSEEERRSIEKKAKEIARLHSSDPVAMRKEMKILMRTKPRILIAEIIELTINVLVTLLLIRIFAMGLEGADLYLLYPWIPHPAVPYNLVFLGIFDLSRPNLILNIIQSLVILVVEIAAEYTSPFRNLNSLQKPIADYNPITAAKNPYARETRSRVRSLQVALPIVSFLVFLLLPAGKKLFIITTLLFSLMLILVKAARRKFVQVFATPPAAEEGEVVPTT
ncbi:MAG TPA: YidC/Oxa1 family membrane protein insertase [Patescibacteria group bacterium]|nr:YidC/Oxa1 family membrane protein insertase [Patescibacteria group bacterium]